MENKEAYLSTPRRINTLVMRITSMIAFADQKMKINKLPDKIMFDRLQRIIVEELKKNNSIYPNPLDTLNYLRDLRNYTEFKIKNNLKKKENLNIVRAENINEIISKIAVYNNIKSADKVVLNITKEGATFKYINKTAEEVAAGTNTIDPDEAARQAESERVATEIEQKQAALTSKYQDLSNQMAPLAEELKTKLAAIPSDPNDTPEMIAEKDKQRAAIAQPIIEKGKAIETQLQELANDPEVKNINDQVNNIVIQPALEVAKEESSKEQTTNNPTTVNTSTGKEPVNNQVVEQPLEQSNTIVQQPVAQTDSATQQPVVNNQSTQKLNTNQTV